MRHLVLRREGGVKFYAPDPEKYGGIYSAPVFYNPAMEKNRTLSTLLLKAYGKGGLVVCEPLSGTGVRGIRYAVESGVVGKLILNDISKEAVELIKKNLEINGVDAEVYNEDANVLLHKLKDSCDVVDIDPFGSPAPFIHGAFRALKEEGLICATATDTAVLVGRYPRKCLRRYGSVIVKTPFYIEVGLRNLLGYIARVAAAEDYKITPLMSYWEGHYFRVCAYAARGARDADDNFHHIAYIKYERGVRKILHAQSEGSSGPLWVGPLGDPLIINKMSEIGPYQDFLKILAEEYSISAPWFYRLPEFAAGGKSPTLKEAVGVLRAAGIYAVRTHMAPDGFKADGEYGEVLMAFKRYISSAHSLQ
ncbi:N2,N2-dimethylguonasine tRNA methyltransferase [Pyrobaculum aerophilum str. IM2]|uniref:tRNA (guanine(26)-N(2))-dimethyltransferase n=2 Tax=Pyrobaculum aerophilum TaxID=13773 RepID=TRM1_PYRAE|nr:MULTISPECIES: tRNA (guanine(26)-N(2))-dimethyltransferase [Pyrobaculum]Q8ZWT5.1 RecName: Full=tRNA (guanine(26)-N(2))-dimethyltransferase; AltName: Full=tRNA 2,2-dimethylguanosine-26 methyltransferase; AltName: Full=tRNA(guanine-26,N(2)-N(2)) methyltransferase; AltName: Full=tRNA(m(2,2)G26)dimethyltransferase [Pyrobaculum aerophilum str. IM2]AAL63614.1 N2,N2-dimethylguonasine tRNA methyltransferase [Pyrobaculum aerophilum str. IM2]HII46249.1 tRNA (guanine-N2)-dimethyltransferase [Pyrobaculum 